MSNMRNNGPDCSVGRGLDVRLQLVGAVMGPSLFSIHKMPQIQQRSTHQRGTAWGSLYPVNLHCYNLQSEPKGQYSSNR